jgi:arylsulfatase A-like enzyme
MNGRSPSASPLRSALTAALLGAGLGVLMSLLRAQLLLQLAARSYEAQELAMLEGRLARELPDELYPALGLCILAALVGWVALRGPRAHWWLALPAAAAATWYSLVGGPWAVDAQRLDQLSSGDLLPLPVLLIVCGLGALALVGLLRAVLLSSPLPGRAFAALAALGVATVVATPRLYVSLAGGGGAKMTVRLVQREVALDEGSWKVKGQHPASAPRLGILTPSIDYRTDGGDLPSIIMPPPCEVEFEVTQEDGDVHLDFAAGVDDSVNKTHRGGAPLKVGFEVQVNGKRVYTSIIDAYKGKPMREIRWQRPDAAAPELDLHPGDVVTLRTAVVGKSAEKVNSMRPLEVGFGRVVLERRETRDRLPSSPDKPNIVLIVQDTMRADRASLYGYAKSTTPALDALAERGVKFNEARSTSSWTWPSTASILTGLLPDQHGVTDDSACYLLGKNQTLAEALQARGYTTAAWTCNPLISRQKNFDQGFESFTNSGGRFQKTEELIDELRSWIRWHAGTRFFLYLHLVDPHAPYQPLDECLAEVGEPVPEDFPGQQVLESYKKAAMGGLTLDKQGALKPDPFPEGHIRQFEGLYDASILTGDVYLAALVEELEESDLLDETIVVFTSDHGEEWLEHGQLTHGQSVHRELVHVPLVMAGPGLPSGVQVDTPVSNRHLAPTLARIGGGELAAAGDALDLTAPSEVPQRAVYFATTHGSWNGRKGRQPIYGVREGRWALHYAPQGSDFGVPAAQAPEGGQVKLYDLEADPGEQRDVSAQHPEVAARLRESVLDSLARQVAGQKGSVELGGGAATMEMLNGIGYLDDK